MRANRIVIYTLIVAHTYSKNCFEEKKRSSSMNKQKLLKEQATIAKQNQTSPKVAIAKDKVIASFEKGENEK